jgi:hypothetical protein
MQEVTVSKMELLKILDDNRAKHRRVFEKAIEGYRKEYTAQLERRIADLKAGKTPEEYFRITRPEDHTADYDRVIRMVQMHQEDTLALDEEHFMHYVQDDWVWKRQFLRMSTTYAAAAVHSDYPEFAGDET